MFCEACHKRFGNSNAYENHLTSKKHKDAIVKAPESRGVKARTKSETEKIPEIPDQVAEEEGDEDDMEVEEVDSDEWEEDEEGIPVEDCLFCSHHSRNIQANLSHMMTAHSFFIPDVEYLTDVVPLLNYLGRKIGLRFHCIWCSNEKRFTSLDAVQKHMTSLGHCKMRHDGDGLAEYSDFYDYTSSYPDKEDAEPEEEIRLTSLDSTGFELALPSGGVIGHRSLLRYYRQKIPNRNPMVNSRKVLKDVISSYMSRGWTATDRKLAAQKARDIKYMSRMRQKEFAAVGIKGNKLQRHFRAQTNF
ncbi:unnamed protein product [Notodromas monacha]|uniref:C2H2-type domain-containing protein n=1 Tax=Notodromas monacha TaxID=399045 RepID=A0A7R9GAM0_9CRUS|nr:unnamed protein product [Notodromas monacha]CAG0914134.1 unnamed protein product [Notodromas monacha]